MIWDKELMFSNGQTIAASAVSANIIDQSVKGDSYKRMWLYGVVEEDFAGGNSVKATLQTSDTEDFAAPVELCSSPVVPVADLKAGAPIIKVGMPLGAKKYLRVNYTVDGAMTEGKVNCGLVLDVDNNSVEIPK